MATIPRASATDIFPLANALRVLGLPSSVNDATEAKVMRMLRQTIRWAEVEINTYLDGRLVQLDCIIRKSDRRVFVTGQDFLEDNPQEFFSTDENGYRYHDLIGHIDLASLSITGVIGTVGDGEIIVESIRRGTTLRHRITLNSAPAADTDVETLTVMAGVAASDVFTQDGDNNIPNYNVIQPNHVGAMEDYIVALDNPEATEVGGYHPLLKRARDQIREGAF